MYYALSPSLQTILELSEHRDGKDFSVFLDAFLRGLSTLGTSASILYALRKHFRTVGAVKEDAGDGASDLESILRQHDLLLGPDMGGFANLLRSAVEENEVFSDDEVDFEGLEPHVKDKLHPLGQSNLEITALDDVSDVFSLSPARTASCIVMDALSLWTSEEAVVAWMEDRDYLHGTLRLFKQRSFLDQITANFVQRDLSDTDLQDFSLWYVSRFLGGRILIGPLERRLVDTMLKKAELGSLATFENIQAPR